MKLVDLNKPIPELNGLTLNEVFDDGNIIGIDENNIVKNATGWSINDAFGSTHFFVNNLSSTLNYIIPTNNATIPKIKLSIGNDVYLIRSFNVAFADTPGTAGIKNTGQLFVRVSSVTYPTAISFINYLTSNNVRFVYEKVDANANANVYINLTNEIQLDKIALGIPLLTQAQLDNYFALYQSGVEASGFVQKTFSGDTKFALAKGIDAVAHGGLTYREIFEGGNKSSVVFTSGIEYEYQYFTNSGVPQFFEISSSLPLNNIYVVNKGKVIGGNQTGLEMSYRSYNSSLAQLTQHIVTLKSTDVNETFYSNLFVLPSSAGAYGIRGGGSLPNNTYNLDSYVINTTQLFGAGNEPNKATMDKLYQQYEEAGTVQAQAFIQTAGKDTRVIDAKLPYLNMMSIREVFESNLDINSEFNSATGWTLTNATISNGNLNYDSAIAMNAFTNVATIPTNQSLYVVTNIKRNDTTGGANVQFRNGTTVIGSSFVQNTLTNQYQNISFTFTSSNSINGLIITRVGGNSLINIDYIRAYNLTTLNLTHLTQAELDAMFALYEAGTLKLSDVFEDNQASSIATLSQTQQDDIAKAYTRYKGPLFIDTDGVAYGQVFISKGGQ